jgi:hypothetical protein
MGEMSKQTLPPAGLNCGVMTRLGTTPNSDCALAVAIRMVAWSLPFGRSAGNVKVATRPPAALKNCTTWHSTKFWPEVHICSSTNCALGAPA